MKIFSRTFSLKEYATGFIFLCFGLIAWGCDSARTRYLNSNFKSKAAY